jgi:hypothetical protein
VTKTDPIGILNLQVRFETWPKKLYKEMLQMPNSQTILTQQTTQVILPTSPTPGVPPEPPKDVILAIAILLSVVLGSVTALVQAITMAKKSG